MSRIISKHQAGRIKEVRKHLQAKGYSFHVRPGNSFRSLAVLKLEQGLKEAKAIKEGKLKGGTLKSLFDGK